MHFDRDGKKQEIQGLPEKKGKQRRGDANFRQRKGTSVHPHRFEGERDRGNTRLLVLFGCMMTGRKESFLLEARRGREI